MTLISWLLKGSELLFDLSKSLLDLKTKLQGAVERDLLYCKLKVILDLSVDETACFNLKIHLRKKSLWNNLSLYAK